MTNNNIKPIIVGIESKSLSKKEYLLFKKNLPIGYIIFSRNIENINQLKSLIQQLKSINKRHKAIIMIDHEGGRVNRLNKILNQDKYTAKYFGDLYSNNKKQFNTEIKKFVTCNSNIFNYIGVNLVAAPVLDLFYSNKSKIVGDRSYSSNVKIVKHIGKLIIEEYKKYNIKTIAKHAPGHGLATIDSHFSLPVVNHSKSYLFNNDFKTFYQIKSDFLMTAHILYKNVDSKNLATFSHQIIKKILKKKLSFKGLIMTDDICMKALTGSVMSRANKSLKAGCDLVLHCNGNYDEMNKLLVGLPTISPKLFKKINKIFN